MLSTHWGMSRDLVTTITDFDDAATPVLIQAYSSDQVSMGETGSDTLTTDGLICSTVTYQYSEQTSDNSTVSESDAAAGWSRVGSASDSYSTTDSGTITGTDAGAGIACTICPRRTDAGTRIACATCPRRAAAPCDDHELAHVSNFMTGHDAVHSHWQSGVSKDQQRPPAA